MPVFLKDVKKQLQADADKVGLGPDGQYKSVPPNTISRKLKDYTKLKTNLQVCNLSLPDSCYHLWYPPAFSFIVRITYSLERK